MWLIRFQFQHGTIKRGMFNTIDFPESSFQFQHGTIKSRLISLHKYQQIRGYFNYQNRLFITLLSSIGNHMILSGDRQLLQINELAVFHYKLPIQKIPIPVDRRLL